MTADRKVSVTLSEREDVASGEDLEALCVQRLRRARWPEQVNCPHCHSEEVTDIRQYMDVFQRYLCLVCGRTFNDKTGTIFENSKVSLSAWAGTAYLLAADQPITVIAENIGVSYPTALRMVRELRGSKFRYTFEVFGQRMLSSSCLETPAEAVPMPPDAGRGSPAR